MATEKSKGEIRDLSEDELNIAVSGPAIFSNRFYVISSPPGVRISFADQNGPQKITHFRTAVHISLSDAMTLSNVLERMIKDTLRKLGKDKVKLATEESSIDSTSAQSEDA